MMDHDGSWWIMMIMNDDDGSWYWKMKNQDEDHDDGGEDRS